jgi:hypothetical protein
LDPGNRSEEIERQNPHDIASKQPQVRSSKEFDALEPCDVRKYQTEGVLAQTSGQGDAHGRQRTFEHLPAQTLKVENR